MTRIDSPRDELVATALRELDTPPHAPGFEDALRRRLAAERGPRPRRVGRRGLVLRLAAAAVVVAVVGLAFGISRLGESSVDVASAAEVQAKVRSALGSVAHMQGLISISSPDPLSGEPVTGRWAFATTADGDFRLDELGGPGRVAYDSQTGIERQLNSSASMGTGLFASVRSGLAPGPPDQGPSDWLLQRDLGAVVRALLGAKDAAVQNVRYEGREAWRVELAVQPNAIFADADRLEVTVDQATGIPVRVLETLHGERRRVLRVERLSLDAPLPADAFTLAFPPGMEVARTDYGFRRVELSDVRAAVGYAPFVPAWVPGGFALSEVAVAAHTAPTGAEAGNPPSEDVVSLAYRRGFDTLIVTTRRDLGKHWDDPLATGEGFVDHPDSVTIDGGALAGVNGNLLIAPRGTPHVWALADGLVVTVSGDVGRDELLRIATSLRREG